VIIVNEMSWNSLGKTYVKPCKARKTCREGSGEVPDGRLGFTFATAGLFIY
jgi:hypothetical protein